jgi:hypothetical protein
MTAPTPSADVSSLIDPRIIELFNKSEGKAWEPPDLKRPWIKQLIADGYLRPCTMRCGFEAFDSGVEWTSAARAAITASSTEAAIVLKRLVEAAQPFADSINIDPNKKRGQRHWSTYGKPTNIDDVLRLKNALAALKAGA